MQAKPNPRILAVAFLAVSAAVSIAVLATRNLYDDEISTVHNAMSPVADILRTAAISDVHPPGMYLLAHAAYRILPSFRWMNLVPCLVLYAGLAVFLLPVTSLFARTRARLCLLLLATLHPQLFLWSTTFRWYSWWSGLALIALTVALQPGNPRPALTAPRAVVLGLLLACLFYLNYITLLFALALATAMLLRYRVQTPKRLLASALLTLAVSTILIAPQLHTMIAVHLPNGQSQHYSLAVSFLRLVQSLAASEAYLPWHPLAILADLLFALLCLRGLSALLRTSSPARDPAATPHALPSILLFGFCFFLLVVLTGLGGKPRNGLLLIPVLVPAAAFVIGTFRPRVQVASLLFLALWSTVGVAHILGRYGLAKATMNDHPEQVVTFVRQTSPACSVIVTYDIELAFALAQAHLPHLLILSPFDSPVVAGASVLPAGDCAHTRLYAVQSYLGATDPARPVGLELQSSAQWIEGQPDIHPFSFDPDARRKRSLPRIPGFGHDLAPAAQLPDYRYVVTSGPIDPANLQAMRKNLPDYSDGH